MSFISLIGIEFQKIRRSRIVLILTLASVILWLPSILNAHLNFQMQAEGISPENNFFIQGFMGLAWFMFPGCMVVVTVLINQIERMDRGLLKMLSLPVSAGQLSLAKFTVLLSLAALEYLLSIAMYYASAAIASRTQGYAFPLPPLFIFQQVALMLLSSVPMLAVFHALSVCVQTSVFSIGAGLATIVPSVLMINTKFWYVYPMAYPFYVLDIQYTQLAENFTALELKLLPWLPVAVGITLFCLLLSCRRFGKAERR